MCSRAAIAQTLCHYQPTHHRHHAGEDTVAVGAGQGEEWGWQGEPQNGFWLLFLRFPPSWKLWLFLTFSSSLLFTAVGLFLITGTESNFWLKTNVPSNLGRTTKRECRQQVFSTHHLLVPSASPVFFESWNYEQFSNKMIPAGKTDCFLDVNTGIGSIVAILDRQRTNL